MRSLSKHHEASPFVVRLAGEELRVDCTPGESTAALFGGNSKWRGPVWFPLNVLLIEALERYHHYHGDELTIECPKGSGERITLRDAADEIRARLIRLFLSDERGVRPHHGAETPFANDPHGKDLVYFHEHFHPDTDCGLGAAHQTGWAALIHTLLRPAALAAR